VPDPATNSLLIAATRSRYDEVLDMVQRLDQRQDQVLIETALVELTGRDFLTLGIELGLADIPGSNQIGGFGVSSFGLSSFQDTDGDGIPDARVPNVGGGMTAGILDGEDFSLPVLIQALEQDQNSNVLSKPSILVSNNGGAFVETKDEQPTTNLTTSGASVSGFAQETFGGYQEAGITLSISPTISASRYLRLNISLQISNFLGTVSGPIPPPRLTRLVQTTVNVPDGATMVIGGIIVDNLVEAKEKVPFLGDLPVLGPLFRVTEETKERTSLYFFVTPHIMRDREFADLADYSYQKKLEAADSIGADRIRLIDEKFGEDKGIPGFDVPLFQGPGGGEVDEGEIGIDLDDIGPMLDSKRESETEAPTPVEPAPQEGPAPNEGPEDWMPATDGQ